MRSIWLPERGWWHQQQCGGRKRRRALWVWVTRSGSTFTAYSSTNGTTWTQVGTPQTFTMASRVYLGPLVSNHGGTGTATFGNVTSP
jgi:hypothetical protein